MPPEPPPAAAAQTGAVVDPFRNYNFRLEFPNAPAARFVECSGLGVRVHPIRYREGGGGAEVRKLPGPVDYGEVTLRYGLTESRELWTWLTDVAAGRVRRMHVSVAMLDLDGSTERIRWNLNNAWPCEWRGAALDALGREAAIEEMRLVFDSLARA